MKKCLCCNESLDLNEQQIKIGFSVKSKDICNKCMNIYLKVRETKQLPTDYKRKKVSIIYGYERKNLFGATVWIKDVFLKESDAIKEAENLNSSDEYGHLNWTCFGGIKTIK